MKVLIPILIGLLVAGCGESKEEKSAKAVAQHFPDILFGEPTAEAKEQAAVTLEEAIRKGIRKPEGELTKADLEKVTFLNRLGNQLTEVPKGLEKLTKLTGLGLANNQLTDVKGLEKLTQLTQLLLSGNPDLTKAQIDQLQKALPNCKIYSNPKK